MRHPDYVPSGLKAGRSYDDFLDYFRIDNIERRVEIDTVIGRIGGKVILTIHFTSCNFMASLLLDNKSAQQATLRFSELKCRLRSAGFSMPALMDALLTDNGGESSDVFSFENDENRDKENPLFFCDPMHSSQDTVRR